MALTLQVIGKKKSGKTTTMLSFIEAACQAKLQVATFKHTHHTVSMDVEGTDTARFAKAGAKQVGMQNDLGFFWHETRNFEEKVPLEKEIANYVKAETDLILVEGFKWETYPKLLLLRPEDQVTDFESISKIRYVASLYPEKAGEVVLDFSTVEKRKGWFEKFYQEAKDGYLNTF